MIRPPIDPRYRPAPTEPTWQNVVVSYAMIAAVPALLWVVSQPPARIVGIAAVVGLYVAAKRLHRLVRCFRNCRGFAFDLGRTVRITVTKQHTGCEATDQRCAI